MTPPTITVSNLEVWRGDSLLVQDLSFRAAGGDLVHVAGPNGSGKTTLLRTLVGLTLPESGTIAFDDIPLHADLPGYHRHVAWLGHRDGLKPELSVRENLVSQARLRGNRARSVDELLGDAGLRASAGSQVRLLSAGQKRRAALARVFGSGASIWILDEPFANLDTDGRQWGMSRVRDHLGAGGIAVLTTHLPLDLTPAKQIELGSE